MNGGCVARAPLRVAPVSGTVPGPTGVAYNRWGTSRLNRRTCWELPAGDRHNLILGYQWGRSAIRLRIENLFDVRQPQPGSFDQSIGITNPRNVRFGYTLTFH